MNPEQRGELAERLLPVAARLICLVQDGGGPRDIEQDLARLDGPALAALPVILAALADPDRQIADALAWITWEPQAKVTGTLRDLAEATESVPSRQPRGMAIVEDTAELVRLGHSRDAIAERLGVTWNTVTQVHLRTGAPLPAMTS